MEKWMRMIEWSRKLVIFCFLLFCLSSVRISFTSHLFWKSAAFSNSHFQFPLLLRYTKLHYLLWLSSFDDIFAFFAPLKFFSNSTFRWWLLWWCTFISSQIPFYPPPYSSSSPEQTFYHIRSLKHLDFHLILFLSQKLYPCKSFVPLHIGNRSKQKKTFACISSPDDLDFLGQFILGCVSGRFQRVAFFVYSNSVHSTHNTPISIYIITFSCLKVIEATIGTVPILIKT